MTKITFDEPSTGEVTADNVAALKVTNKGTQGMGVYGESPEYQGVHGTSTKNAGVVGQSEQGWGVYGVSTKAAGVQGESEEYIGVAGVGKGKGAGVYGESTAADGVKGVSTNAAGVAGSSTKSFGIWGVSETTYGIYGHSNGFDGIKGETHGALAAGVAGYNFTNKGYGIWGAGGEWAGYFYGNVAVTGDIKLLNADCAEDFEMDEENVEPGTVMVLTENGSLRSSYRKYDKKVAGIISGAGEYKPAIILGSQHSQSRNDEDQNDKNKSKQRLPIALMGKVYCKVDGRHSSIEIGDLLTTSSTKGCAMKANDLMEAFGAVIGKPATWFH
jgi:hypothetical protein